MAVARLVSLFESKTLDHSASTPHTNLNTNSFAARSLRSLRLPPNMSSEDTFCLSIQPQHFSRKRASRQRYYDSSSASSSADSSPSSSYRSNRYSFRSMSPMSSLSFSGSYTSTRRRFSQHLGLRRIPSHVDLALAAERDEQGLDLLEPRPVAAVEGACFGRSSTPPVVLENIFEVLEGH